ncbi:hypothetical protein P692DRAFT_20758645, partial [Suillus brevipes Sb2]
SPNEYLQQWKFRTKDYLDILLRQEAPPQDRVCCLCDGDGAQRCHDCLSRFTGSANGTETSSRGAA